VNVAENVPLCEAIADTYYYLGLVVPPTLFEITGLRIAELSLIASLFLVVKVSLDSP
jgi:hypothetical protein